MGLDSYQTVTLDKFAESFSTFIELSSVALDGRVISVSDDFFAEAFHLLLVEPAPSLKGQFGPKGALFSGWESRRHNPAYDWCIIKLGTSGSISGFDIDTSHFSGNEAPQASVQGLYSVDHEPDENDPAWREILPRVDLGPNSRHLFSIPATECINYVKLNMYPDGGIARFRAYGLVAPVFPADASIQFDLAHVLAGGRVVFTSDQHFGVGSNLILPGRGKDMGDGWETRRSRQKGHKDWVVIRLGTPGHLTSVEVDTAHFKGNFPESCEIHALESSELIPLDTDDAWTLILPRTKLGPHKQHYFALENVEGKVYTHVKLTIYPDGGVKRLRIFGTRVSTADITGDELTAPGALDPMAEATTAVSAPVPTVSNADGAPRRVLPVLPLTAEAFAPFGRVVQAYADPHGAPRSIKTTGANQGSATKFHKVSLIEACYPEGSGATAGLSVYRCLPISAKQGDAFTVRLLERHIYTNQAFIPMSGAPSTQGWGAEDALQEHGKAYLVIVALNGEDDKPDLSTLRAFVANGGQGIVYDTGIWHHPMAVLERPMDLTCVETQIGDGSKADCEIVELNASEDLPTLVIPTF